MKLPLNGVDICLGPAQTTGADGIDGHLEHDKTSLKDSKRSPQKQFYFKKVPEPQLKGRTVKRTDTDNFHGRR
jgi:hypothetical protein